MFWGQFVTRKSKTETKCEQCEVSIPPDIEMYGLVVRTRTGARYTRHYHQTCFSPYIAKATIARQDLIREHRAEPRPGRRLELDEAKLKRRKILLQYIAQHKSRLIIAYVMHKPIETAKRNIVKCIEELETGELGPVPKVKFGPNLLELYQSGVDEYISFGAAQESDRLVGNMKMLALLAPDRPSTDEADNALEMAFLQAELKEARAARGFTDDD